MNHAIPARGVVGGLCLMLAVSGAYAQQAAKAAAKPDTYPTRPVRFVAPFVPGGPSDIMSRMLAAKLSEAFGQQFIVDNRGSAGGIVGFEIGARAAPDGYTIMIAANSGFVINQHVYHKLSYNPERDFQPISQLTQGGNVVVVHPSVKATTIKEFVSLAKSQPGKLNYATTGTGNVLGIANFNKMAGIDMVPIAYKGTGQAVLDLVAGHVQFFLMNPLVAIPHVKTGRLRALAVTAMERNPALPDLPTVDEAGVPGYRNVTWHSIVMPAGVPPRLIKRMNAEVVKAVNSPDIKDKISGDGLTVMGSTVEQLVELIKRDSAEYAKLVRDIGFQKL
ncbi:MAG: tripartite tricarboxylate transporter substrate binding protein [Betaproteobacteria bacterium]|nr:tripartite tricarboxylate transporter substrate binding protein [Betaproteobacteria bacterium]